MKRMILVLVVAMAGELASSEVEAAPDDASINSAKTYYEKGNAAYNLGKFEEAITWFTKAYETWAVPDFLYNIAQSYRLGGNCKQALFVYKRYWAVKEKDLDNPLTKKERSEVERFINELTVCAAKTDLTAQTPPDVLKTTLPTPPTTMVPATTTPNTITTTTSPITPANATSTLTPTTVNMTMDPDLETGDHEVSSTTTEANLFTAYVAGGFAIFSSRGKLSIPVQSSLAIGLGYVLPIKVVTLDVGGRLSYSPILYEYDLMSSTKNAALVGVRATIGATYRVARKITLRGDVGIGIVLISGLVDGNPFAMSREASSFKMPSVRIGASVDIDIVSNLVATVAPLSYGFSPMPSDAFIDSLYQFDVLVGLGYHM